MANTYLLTDASKRYLCRYYRTLDEMVQGVTTARLTQSISHNFVVQMIPHHRAAIQISEDLLEVSDSRTLRLLARRIIDRQNQCIARMEAALPACTQLATPQMDLRLYQRRTDLILREMFAAMGAAPEGNRLDAVFLRQMLPHHEGAVRMARNALRYEVCLELAPTLRSIIDGQCGEVGQMRALLRRMGCPGR